MFDIGFSELVLTSVVGLVVLGPERLPSAVQSVARFIRNAKKIANGLKGELEREVASQEYKKHHEPMTPLVQQSAVQGTEIIAEQPGNPPTKE